MKTTIVVDVAVPADMGAQQFEQLQSLVQDIVREVLKRREEVAPGSRPPISRAETHRQLVELFLDADGLLDSADGP